MGRQIWLPEETGITSIELDKPTHECGVVGVVSPSGRAVEMGHLAISALQHRGEEGAGVGTDSMVMRDFGSVATVFGEKGKHLDGYAEETSAIFHVRYSTNGSKKSLGALQPVWDQRTGQMGVHNGNVTNGASLAKRFGIKNGGLTDSATMFGSIGEQTLKHNDVETALQQVLPFVKGAFSAVLRDKGTLIAFRDRFATHPLHLGALPDGGFIVASETPALDVVGAEYEREIAPGTYEVISNHDIRTHRWSLADRKFCVFEEIYFARPDHRENDVSMHTKRKRMGEILWRERPREADVVIGVPDSGRSGAIGVAKASGIPFDEGMFKNRTVGRYFTQPNELERNRILSVKHNAIRDVVEGQRVIVVDDSVVRGKTARRQVEMLRDAGASEVHFYVASPPYMSPCFYGIDIGDTSDLVAVGRTEEEIAEYLGADSMNYLSINGLHKAVDNKDDHCDACLTGNYPEPVDGVTFTQKTGSLA